MSAGREDTSIWSRREEGTKQNDRASRDAEQAAFKASCCRVLFRLLLRLGCRPETTTPTAPCETMTETEARKDNVKEKSGLLESLSHVSHGLAVGPDDWEEDYDSCDRDGNRFKSSSLVVWRRFHSLLPSRDGSSCDEKKRMMNRPPAFGRHHQPDFPCLAKISPVRAGVKDLVSWKILLLVVEKRMAASSRTEETIEIEASVLVSDALKASCLASISFLTVAFSSLNPVTQPAHETRRQTVSAQETVTCRAHSLSDSVCAGDGVGTDGLIFSYPSLLMAFPMD